MSVAEKSVKLKEIYESIPDSKDPNTTASDFKLRELEIDLALKHIKDGDKVLDIGCGPAVAIEAYAKANKIEAYGVDYSENMVSFAKERVARECPELGLTLDVGNVLELDFPDNSFDVITTHRCLMALLDWDLQQKAIQEIRRILKPGGTYVMMEGTIDGIERLNKCRLQFGLDAIDPTGSDRLMTKKFNEAELLAYLEPLFSLEHVQRFGMYYFITRILQPLLVAPNAPSYDHPLNDVAKAVALKIPDFDGLGHLVGFILKKPA